MTCCTIKTTRKTTKTGTVHFRAMGYDESAREWVGMNYGMSQEENHKRAALELIRRRGWTVPETVIGVMIPGPEPSMLWTVPADAATARNVITPEEI